MTAAAVHCQLYSGGPVVLWRTRCPGWLCKGMSAQGQDGLQVNALHVLMVFHLLCLQEVSALQPDLIIGDASASFGHWLTTLTGIPGIDFDVGTSSGLLHSMHGGQFNPAYLPAPGKAAAWACMFCAPMQNIMCLMRWCTAITHCSFTCVV